MWALTGKPSMRLRADGDSALSEERDDRDDADEVDSLRVRASLRLWLLPLLLLSW